VTSSPRIVATVETSIPRRQRVAITTTILRFSGKSYRQPRETVGSPLDD
jgi:hypothetical protein